MYPTYMQQTKGFSAKDSSKATMIAKTGAVVGGTVSSPGKPQQLLAIAACCHSRVYVFPLFAQRLTLGSSADTTVNLLVAGPRLS
jgi:hypothetical protein